VKIITPEEDEVLEDFLVEINILKRCKHENIVGFFGSWLKGEELFVRTQKKLDVNSLLRLQWSFVMEVL
jgi:hypothetical protein